MPKYLAQYQINATGHSFTGWKPYEYRRNYNFSAKDENSARIMAKEETNRIRKELIDASVFLESLLEVREININ